MGGGVAVVLNSYRPEASGGDKLCHTHCVMDIAGCSDWHHIITGDISGLAILWDVLQGKALRAMQLPAGGLAGICKLDWNSQGNSVSHHMTGKSAITELPAEAAVTAKLWCGNYACCSAIFAPIFCCTADANRGCMQVVCSAGRGKAVVWDVATGKIRHELVGHNTFGVVRTCKYSPDGTLVSLPHSHSQSRRPCRVPAASAWHEWLQIASGGDFGIVIIWDAATGKQVKKLSGHSDHVNTCSWSPDSRRLASGSADGMLVISDVQPEPEPLILASSVRS